jgi:hypothetical protein
MVERRRGCAVRSVQHRHQRRVAGSGHGGVRSSATSWASRPRAKKGALVPRAWRKRAMERGGRATWS